MTTIASLASIDTSKEAMGSKAPFRRTTCHFRSTPTGRLSRRPCRLRIRSLPHSCAAANGTSFRPPGQRGRGVIAGGRASASRPAQPIMARIPQAASESAAPATANLELLHQSVGRRHVDHDLPIPPMRLVAAGIGALKTNYLIAHVSAAIRCPFFQPGKVRLARPRRRSGSRSQPLFYRAQQARADDIAQRGLGSRASSVAPRARPFAP